MSGSLPVSHTYAATGAYSVSLAVSSVAGCADVQTHTVQVDLIGAAFDLFAPAGCAPATVAFTSTFPVQSSGPVVYSWSFGDGQSASGAGLVTVTHTYAEAGRFVPSLTVLGPGCAASVTRTLDLDLADAAFAASRDLACLNTTLHFTATGSTVSTGGPAQYLWTWGDGLSQVGPGIRDRLAPVQLARRLQRHPPRADRPGLHRRADPERNDRVAGRDRHGPDGLSDLRRGSIEFSPTVASQAGGVSYLWDFGDGAGSGQARPTHAYAAAGDYTASVTVMTPGGCSDTFTRTLSIRGVDAGFTAGPDPACTGSLITFNSTTAYSGTSVLYSWGFATAAPSPTPRSAASPASTSSPARTPWS